MADPVLVVHTTEGSTIAGAVAAMDRNRSWSNWITDPDTGETRVLVDGEREDRSLRNLPGGVETNNRPGVWQIEIVGHATDIPHMSDRWYQRLAATIDVICRDKGIPRRFPYPFVAYPDSYGAKAPQRLTGAQWLAVGGIVGHQHVPENLHGDPGDISRLIPLVAMKEPPMPTANPYAAEVNEALQLLTEHSIYTGQLDGWFGPAALAALHHLKNQLLNAETELDDALADGKELRARVAELLDAGAVPPEARTRLATARADLEVVAGLLAGV